MLDCECILAPRFMKGKGKGRRQGFCGTNCRVKIDSRIYHDCSRQEVLEALIDFEQFEVVPRSVLEGDEDEVVREYERHRKDASEVLY